MVLPDSSILTNIRFAGNAKPGNLLFEKKYIGIRSMENRMYSDAEVEALPSISKAHTHAGEWRLREQSSKRLISYLAAMKRPLRILEVGCGNGWLSHALASIPESSVVGLDINFTELQQAARIFSDTPHLKFIYGDIYSAISSESTFDVIVFSASIQYFKSLGQTVQQCFRHLVPLGEIHLMDSHFYKAEDIGQAKKRTEAYYVSLGYPDMADYYFHHNIDSLQRLRHTILFNPHSAIHRLFNRSNPFHWIRIKK